LQETATSLRSSPTSAVATGIELNAMQILPQAARADLGVVFAGRDAAGTSLRGTCTALRASRTDLHEVQTSVRETRTSARRVATLVREV
jgi:hypothetical protein